MVRNRFICAAALALAAMVPLDLAAESLTLTTYYPAPYGVYQRLRTTDSTYLAYQAANAAVSVGRVPSGTTLGGTDADPTKNFPQSGYSLDVNGKTMFRNIIHIARTVDSMCTPMTGSGNASVQLCPADRYAAWVPGMWQEGTIHMKLPTLVGNIVGFQDGVGNWVEGHAPYNDSTPATRAEGGVSIWYDPTGGSWYCCAKDPL